MRQTSDWPIKKSIVQASSISARCTILSPLIRWFWMSLSSKGLKKLLLCKPASWNSFPKVKEPQPRLWEGLAHRLRAHSASPSGCGADWSWSKRRSRLSRAWRPPCTSRSGLVEPSWAPSPWGPKTAPRTSWPKCHRTPSGNAAPPSGPAGWNWRSQAPWPPSWTMATSRARQQLVVLGSLLLPPPALGAAGSQGPAWGAAERGLAPWLPLQTPPHPSRGESENEAAQSCPTLSTPWTAAYHAPPSMRFSRQECWSGCHFLLQRIEPGSPTL